MESRTAVPSTANHPRMLRGVRPVRPDFSGSYPVTDVRDGTVFGGGEELKVCISKYMDNNE